MAVADWAHSLDQNPTPQAPSNLRDWWGRFMVFFLSGAERKTGWTLAEEVGLTRPCRIQSLLGRSSWSADRLCERVRSYLIGALGDPDGVLVVDETGFLKNGMYSVGVAQQYCGTAGRTENCQNGVFASYASRWGYEVIRDGTAML